jgi:hypothetical protein
MMELAFYALVAIVLLVASLWLFVKGVGTRAESPFEDSASGFEQLETSSLNLAERIFDPGDRDWLGNELCFPEAAVALERHRKRLAIQWLKALRNSFKELVRLPQPSPDASKSSGWELLRLTLRFHFLINYALLAVRLFGPYHRMVPILGSMHSIRQLGFFKKSLDHVGVERVS